MTAITTTTVTGRVAYPDDTSASLGSVEFLLTGYDAEASADVTVVPKLREAAIDSSGDISIALWPNSEGLRDTQYQVTAVLPNSSGADRVNLGRITVPSNGPVDLNDLLSTSPVIDSSEEILTPQQFGDTTTDSTAAINAMLAKSVLTGKRAYVYGLHNVSGSIAPSGAYDCHWANAQLTWIGSDVTSLTEVMENPNGTSSQQGSGKYVLFDTSGCTGATNTGKLTIRGSSPGNMTLGARANIPENLVAITASTGSSADMTWDTLSVIGCGHDLWQGDQRGTDATILPYTRWTGKLLQSQFCLQTLTDGNDGNGFNEFRFQNIEVSRPGGNLEIRSDFGGTLFFKGPRFSANNDVETPTIAVTAGSTSATLSADILDGDSNSRISVGDEIVIEDAANNANASNTRGHVTNITAKTGTAITLETAPDVTIAAARFQMKPGSILISSACYMGGMIYLEGSTNAGIILKDGGKISSNTVIEVSNGEYASRYGSAVVVAGTSAIECTATLHQRTGVNNTNLSRFIAVGTVHSGTDYGELVLSLTAHHSKADFVKFDLIGGVRLESDHAASFDLDPGVPLGPKSMTVRYPDGVQWYEVHNHGPASEARFESASSYDSLGSNIRANDDMTGVIGSGTCGSPSGGVVTKSAGGDGTWYEGVGTMAVGNKYLVEFTVDAANAYFDPTTGEPGVTFQLFRSAGSETPAGDPMLPNYGVPIRGTGPMKVHVTVPDGLLPNRVGFNCKAGGSATISRLVVRQVEDA